MSKFIPTWVPRTWVGNPDRCQLCWEPLTKCPGHGVANARQDFDRRVQQARGPLPLRGREVQP